MAKVGKRKAGMGVLIDGEGKRARQAKPKKRP
jgi:hypothetical protein